MKNKTPSQNSPNLLEGDIFYTVSNNTYHAFKLLAIDAKTETYHILAFEPSEKLPAISDIDHWNIVAYHSPFDKNAFTDAVILGNKPVRATDLIGYHEYLKQTQEPATYISLANDYYKDGYRLTTAKQHKEAIDSYTKAIDLFPQFYEAIDNRAFCKMDLGLWTEAIEDFKLSLQHHPVSMLAEFSIGECYFKLGDYPRAKTQFEIAAQLDPNHQAPKVYLQKVNAILNA